MSPETTYIIVSAVAALFLGTVSNWLYDLLKRKGVYSEKPPVKVLLVICLTVAVFIGLNVWPNIPVQDKAAVLEFLQRFLPLWLVLPLLVFALSLGYAWGAQKVKSKLNEAERKLETLEQRYAQSNKPTRPSDEPIIRLK